MEHGIETHEGLQRYAGLESGLDLLVVSRE